VDKPTLSQIFDQLIEEHGKETVWEMAQDKCKGAVGRPEKKDEDTILFLIEARVRQLGQPRKTAIRHVLADMGLPHDDKEVERVRTLSNTRAKWVADAIEANPDCFKLAPIRLGNLPPDMPKPIFDAEELMKKDVE
jgi:hypothetical protein